MEHSGCENGPIQCLQNQGLYYINILMLAKDTLKK